MKRKISVLALFLFLMCTCSRQSTEGEHDTTLQGQTWAEKLGYPKDKRVLILHADDAGMCVEANQATIAYLIGDHIQSAAGMVPCADFAAFARWSAANQVEDVGLHMTLTSEWQTHRWGPVSPPAQVPGLVDKDGKMWHTVRQVVQNAKADEVEQELRAQIEHAKSLGMTPGHMDTHMGTLYADAAFTERYLKVAMAYGIPAMVIEFTDPVVQRFRAQGYPIDAQMVALGTTYTLPKLDDFHAVPAANSYAAKKQAFFELVQSLSPGISEIIFHPSLETDVLKGITNSWQQRVWEAEMFADPEVVQFFKDEGIIFTNWKEMMARFRQRGGS